MPSTVEDATHWEIGIAEDNNYVYGSWECPTRCEVQSRCKDCSGIVVGSVRYCNHPLDCMGSFAISRACHRAGAGISIAEARETEGAFLFIGYNEGQGLLDGSADGKWPGHIARSARGPNGEWGWTVEARNHMAGIVYGPFFNGRGWVYAAKDIWLPAGHIEPPPVHHGDFEMLGIELVNKKVAANMQPYGLLDTANRKFLVNHNFRIHWTGPGQGEGLVRGDTDPKFMLIPGEQAVASLNVRSWASDKSYCDFVVLGISGGEWPGRAHF